MSSPPKRYDVTDLEALKTLAHPRRQRIVEYLTVHGPVTSASLARALDLNTGATSYHLRELARFGFVEEVPERARGRERWWQAGRRDLRFPHRSQQSDAMRPLVDEINRLAFASDIEAFVEAQAALAGGTGEAARWQDAFPYSRGTIRLTFDELLTFFEEYIALLNKYKRSDDQTPEGARTVLTRFLAFPASTEDTPAADEAQPGETVQVVEDDQDNQ